MTRWFRLQRGYHHVVILVQVIRTEHHDPFACLQKLNEVPRKLFILYAERRPTFPSPVSGESNELTQYKRNSRRFCKLSISVVPKKLNSILRKFGKGRCQGIYGFLSHRSSEALIVACDSAAMSECCGLCFKMRQFDDK